MMMELVFALILGVAGAFYFFMNRRFSYWSKRGVPFLEPSIPFGNVFDLVRRKSSFGDMFKQFHDKCKGGYIGVYLAAQPTLVVKDLELLKKILIKDFDHFTDRGFFIDEKIDPLTGHLFSLSGQKWHHLRNKLSPTFTSGKLKAMFSTFVDCGKTLQDNISSNIGKPALEDIEIRDLFARFGTNIIAAVAFGHEVDCINEPDHPFRQMGRRVLTPSFRESIVGQINLLSPKIVEYLKLKQISSEIDDFFISLVKNTVDYREKNNVSNKDFMQLLIQLRNGGQVNEDNDWTTKIVDEKFKTMTFSEMAAQAFVFFLAAFETSSTVMSFCLYELAKNQEIQRKVQKEIDTVMQKHDGEITYDNIGDMKYLENCMDEAMRKYPPVPVLIRSCIKDYKIPETDVVIEKKTSIMISVQGLHHDEQYFPEPDKFIPERFEDRLKIPQFAFLPFGDGPRNCIGMRMGRLQSKIGLALVLSKFDFHPAAGASDQLVMDPVSFLMAPIGGIHLKITKRLAGN
jgi:cytochrome P450 family 6